MVEIYKRTDNALDIVVKNKANIVEILHLIETGQIGNPQQVVDRVKPKLYTTQNSFETNAEDGEIGYIRTDNGQTTLLMKLPNGVIGVWKNEEQTKEFINSVKTELRALIDANKMLLDVYKGLIDANKASVDAMSGGVKIYHFATIDDANSATTSFNESDIAWIGTTGSWTGYHYTNGAWVSNGTTSTHQATIDAYTKAETQAELAKKQDALSASQLAILGGMKYTHIEKDKVLHLPTNTLKEFTKYVKKSLDFKPTSTHQTGFVILDNTGIDGLETGTRIRVDMGSVESLIVEPTNPNDVATPEDNAQFFIGSLGIRIPNSSGSASLKWKTKTNPTDTNVFENYKTKLFVLEKTDTQWNFIELVDKPVPFALADMTNVNPIDILLKEHDIDKMTHFTTTLRNIPAYLFEHAELMEINAPNLERIGTGGVLNFGGTTLNLPKVKSIGERAFYNAKHLTSIVAPELTTIGERAFYQYAGTTLDLPKLVSVEYGAFQNGKLLTTLNLPSLTSVGENGFYYFGGTTLDLPELTTIEKGGFQNAKLLTSLNLPKLTHIGYYGLNNYAGTTLDLPALTTIDERGLFTAKKITSLNLPELTTIGKHGLYYYAGTTLNLPKLTHIGELAFSQAKKITSFDLPALTTIDAHGIDFTNAEEINLPALQTMGDSVFANAYKVKHVILPELTTMGDKCFGANSSVIITLTLPKITSIPASSFANFKGSTLTLHKATTIGYHAFYSAMNLLVANLEVATDIEEGAFGFAPISNLNVPKVVNIGKSAFVKFSGNSISLPECITIGEKAFNDASNLTGLIAPKLETINADVFHNANIAFVNLPKAKVILDGAFRNSQITEMNLPILETIGNNVFNRVVNASTTTITLPSKFNTPEFKNKMFGSGNWEQITFTWV